MKILISALLLASLMLMMPGFAEASEWVTGAWLPYWDAENALTETEEIAGQLDSVVAFAGLFDSSDQIYLPEETEALLTQLQTSLVGTDTAVFLSVVNDVEVAPGKYDNKSRDLLRRLFDSESSISAHLESLVMLIDQYGLRGLELDYENLGSDSALWTAYTGFIRRMWAVCQRDGVRLRVVLPWNAPKYTVLPEGPEYTVMCYNLHGYHSGPGPKADFEFLKNVCEMYRTITGTVRMAFATGGFEWSGDKIKAFDQLQAVERLAESGASPERDDASGALKVSFTEDRIQHELWYADGKTLATWRDVCLAYGYEAYDLFRLGGNDLADWAKASFLSPLAPEEDEN